MTITPDDPRLKFVPFDEATTPPPGLIEHLAKRWWSCHPQRGIIYFRPGHRDHWSAQCNSNRDVTEHLRLRLYPWATLVYLESVFRRIDPHDYVN